MDQKPKMPKVRHTWAINPKTRVTPSKKRIEPLVCNICRGEGRLYIPGESDCHLVISLSQHEDCVSCGGTGYVN